MYCEFKADGPGQRCTRCGRRVNTKRQVSAACRVPNAQRPTPNASLDCLHRGDPLRTLACKTCKSSTVEVTVYQCALFGECTKHNYARSNPELAGMHVCRGCPEMQVLGNGGQPPLPRALTRAKNFAGAVLRDRIAGKPRRSPELVARLFNQFCETCPAYNPTEGACADCGCPVNTTEREDNKLAWATEECPRDKWPIQTANLIFYVLPLEHEDKLWQWHVAQLRKRLHIFTGRRIVWVATQGGWKDYLALAPPETVVKEFGTDADKIEFRFAPNSQHQETPAFREMLRMLAYGPSYGGQPPSAVAVAPGDHESTGASSLLPNAQRPTPNASQATFYFHAKGVTRALQDAIRPWCEAIYHHNLDRWNEVREILTVYPCCGIARQPRSPIHLDGVPGGGPWHFAGTGFWFNHAALFGRDGGQPPSAVADADPRPHWDSIQDHSHAVEAYLSTQFPYEAAYCLHGDNAGSTHAGVYCAGAWTNWRQRERVAVASAGTWRENPDDLTLLVLGHDRERLHWVTELPHVQKVFLPDLDPRNDLAESRFFQLPPSTVYRLPSTYLGLCSQSWDRKYAGSCLPLAELDRLERTPTVVWAAQIVRPDWIATSERDHPGMGAVLMALAESLGVVDYRPSAWANNVIAHREVLIDLARFHRRALPLILERWGYDPPYDVSHYSSPWGGNGADRKLSFLMERVTVLYFCTRPDLEVRQIPK